MYELLHNPCVLLFHWTLDSRMGPNVPPLWWAGDGGDNSSALSAGWCLLLRRPKYTERSLYLLDLLDLLDGAPSLWGFKHA
jgi:hypothetical protein